MKMLLLEGMGERVGQQELVCYIIRHAPRGPQKGKAWLQGLSGKDDFFAAGVIVDSLLKEMEIPKTLSQIQDRKSTRLNSSHIQKSRMPSSA